MNRGAGRWYRAQEFAALAGVTVRTLHHYDRLGLLKPRRGESGYRLYREGDLDRLEQVVALKFLGLPLKRIQGLLDREPLAISAALRVQRRILEEKRRRIDSAIRAIREAEERPGAAQLKRIIEVLEMQKESDWMMKYHTDEAGAKVEARREEWTPELQERVSKQWMELIADVRAALGEDPAGPRVQALADRWTKLVEGFTGGDPEIAAGVARLYADQANWPASFQQQAKPFMDKEVWAFMHNAIALRRDKEG